jgi:EAL domain-containing protein (putative c-di-GMP-specific phosphodiesterase class I)
LIKGHEIVTTASIGIVSNLVEYTSAEEVLRDVDIAMYRAKVLGKDCIEVFSPQLHDQVFMRLALESELRHALENHEFELYYQPIFSLTTDQITGFEALIRWNHPARGLLAPNEFLPVAEETGLILQIGQWVLYEACSQLSRWRQIPGLENLTVNVNTSPRQLKQLDFVEQVINVLGETGLSPRALKLEITESMVMDNPVIVNDLFQRLYHLGVQLQVDDFGTGYSSLSYLQHFSFHSIKIDRSFIQEMDRPGRKSDLVRTMVQMAHDLGMNAIAEGVETEEQLAELKRLKCQYAQGFLLSRPIQGALVESRFHVLQLLPELQRVDIPR